MITSLEPVNELEHALGAARSGRLPTEDFLRVLIRSDLAFPSATEVFADGTGFRPVLFESGGASMVAAFTDKGRAYHLASLATFCLTMNALAALRRLPSGYGIVINPKLGMGLSIDPAGIARIIEEMG